MLKLLNLLKDGRFHSGEALGAALGVSRSAVWKQLQHLESELNLTIHKVRGRGYQLAAPLALLEAQAIAEFAVGEQWPVFIHETIDSTNAEGLRLASEGRAAPFLVLAERQSAGRGRRGRQWVSPFAENLYYSLVLRVDGGMRQLEGLSLVVGLAVMRTLQAFGVKDVGLKWPNDVQVGGKKIAGILSELSEESVVIGLGLNLRQRPDQLPITEATSFAIEGILNVSTDAVLTIYLSELFNLYQQFLDADGDAETSGLRTQASEACSTIGQRVAASLPSGEKLFGVASALDPTGALLVRAEPNFELVSVAAGDIVRPGIAIYGASPGPHTAASYGLKPAMRFTSEIIAIQQVQAGERVGYGSRWQAEREGRIAVVACGYADGYPRHAPDGTPTFVEGQVAPVAGRVSMDMMTIDVTHVPEATVGSEVELWGENIPVDVVADRSGTIGYELLCAIAPRVPFSNA